MTTTQQNQTSAADAIRKLMRILGEDPGMPPTERQLRKEAAAFGRRRADEVGSRDNLIYHAGYAIDAVGGLSISPAQLAGILSSISACLHVASLSVDRLAHHHGASFIDGIAQALAENLELALWAEAEGRFLQWSRLKALTEAETEEFRNSPAFDRTGWRNRPPSLAQKFLIAKIAELSMQPAPDLRTRYDAFEFISAVGGNPRFHHAPQRHAFPRLER